MDKITLINGDAIDQLKKLESESVSLVIADPPYNLAKNYIGTTDSMEFQEFLTFSTEWLTEAKRVLKPGGVIYVFMGMRMISYIYQILEKDLNMTFQNWITWHYTQGLGKKKSWSSRHDDILMFSKGEQKTFNLDEIRIPQKYYRSINNMRGANPGNVWNFSHIHYSQKNRAKQHPTQKPEGVIERMILASSNPGDVVLDPFLGSGTTMRVVQQTQRIGIGIEIENEYIEETKERLSEVFYGFDSIDERSLRVPNDLNNSEYRLNYLKNHILWFVKNHENSIKSVITDYVEKYCNKLTFEEKEYIEYLSEKFDFKLDKSITSILNKISDTQLSLNI